MAEIKKAGAPNKHTSGNLGDIYINTITGGKYKLVFICKIENDIGCKVEYDWDPISSDQNEIEIPEIPENVASKEYVDEYVSSKVFGMVNMGQDIKEAMTGGSVAVVGVNSVLNENIVDGQISAKKTDFVKQIGGELITSETNVLTDFSRSNGYVSPGTGILNESTANYTTTNYFPLTCNDQLFVSYTNSAILSFAPIAFYDENKIHISGYTPTISNANEKVEYNGKLGVYYIIPENAKFARVAIATGREAIMTLLLISFTETSKTLIIPDLDLNERVAVLEETDGYDKVKNIFKGEKIVNFGDSIFGNYRDTNNSDDMSISKMMSNRLGATCYNAGFGGCRMADHSSNWKEFSMYSLANSISSNNWEAQDKAIASGVLPDYFVDTLDMLKNMNWYEVSYITIGYGTNDHSGNVFLNGTEASFNDKTQYFKGALEHSIETISTKYPHIKIVILTPMWKWFRVDGAFAYDSNDDLSKNTRGYKLPDYVDVCKDVAKQYQLLCIDNYYELGINKFNYLYYFYQSDGVHPKKSGRQLRADNICANMISKF